ncbi:MAG TPA: arsenical pump-driving ATPase [Candidatus Angelobacter sp.]|nr:arsenical pump-driving ATPase [Candidatus Angelobacter sp.]
MNLPKVLTRNLLFTGKGGVGKTSIACALAGSLADSGKRVLLVSTDPASNLDEVLETRLGIRPTPIPTMPGLQAMNVDPEEAARLYRERVVGPYRELLPKSAVDNIEEQLSGACTVEIAAFDEFAKLLGDQTATAMYDHIIFDTAPTGHTLRLLQLPAAWTGFIENNMTGTSCLGPLAGLQAQKELYAKALQALSDSITTTVFLVSRPDHSALAEAERTRSELEGLGIKNQRLILNGVFHPSGREDAVALALEARGKKALEDMPQGLRALVQDEIALVSNALIGVEALRALNSGRSQITQKSASDTPWTVLPPPLADLLVEIAGSGKGVVMTMGKGGVGKTTVAAAIAVELARMGHRVHLTTTDPAAHLSMALNGKVPALQVTRIDPAAETLAYTEEVMAESGCDLDAKGKALLEEDLRSPCTEEIAVFRAFARRVDEGNDGFVVIDTAPTGHTLLLLDAAEAYHRDVARNLSYIPDSVRRLLPQLRNPEFTRILIVTLPEATPVHEAARLQEDLRRAGIHPYAWVINQSFCATDTKDPVLAERGRLEHRYISEVRDTLASRVALIPWQTEAPVGSERLRQIAEVAA